MLILCVNAAAIAGTLVKGQLIIMFIFFSKKLFIYVFIYVVVMPKYHLIKIPNSKESSDKHRANYLKQAVRSRLD